MFGNDWDEILQDEMQKPYFLELMANLESEYKEHTVYPPKELLFTALKHTPYSETRVVILGQDPYHGAGQAHGLSFSVNPGCVYLLHCVIYIRSYRRISVYQFQTTDPYCAGQNRECLCSTRY